MGAGRLARPDEDPTRPPVEKEAPLHVTQLDRADEARPCSTTLPGGRDVRPPAGGVPQTGVPAGRIRARKLVLAHVFAGEKATAVTSVENRAMAV
jgi:hypothetical protein